MRRRLVGSRSDARKAIDAGLVRVGTVATPKPSTMVAPDEPIHLVADPEPFVSRAGRKLDAALEAFHIDVTGLRCVDVGASTGGFTDCLLQRDAVSVTAVDVGYGQMHWKIRSDSRVDVVERTNIRTADIAALGAPFDVVVSDLSFISLRMVSGQLIALGSDGATWVLLVKPQFEAGRDRVGKGGIVRDPDVRRDVVKSVVETFARQRIGCIGLIRSPITGSTGNVEYVAAFRRGSGTVTDDMIDDVVDGILA